MNEHFKTLISRATSKGQTTIPKEFRDAFGIKEGTLLRWHVENGQLIVRPKTKRLEDFAGMLGMPPNGVRLKIEDMDDAIADAVVEEFERGTR